MAAGLFEDAIPGSNNWAVAGSLTPHDGAIVANDMHLALRVPNVMVWPGSTVVTGSTSGCRRLKQFGSRWHIL